MAELNYLNADIQCLLQQDEEFLRIYERFTACPWNTGHLEPKIKELLNIAISVSPTHLNEAATRFHIQKAMELGAMAEEIAEVMKVVSILGVHTCAIGIPLMMEAIERPEKVPYTKEQEAKKQKFIELMGYWNEFRDDLLRMDEEFFDAYFDFLTAPIRRKILEPKVIEFIYIAIDASTTHLFARGIEIHLKNARKYGATQGEILEVIQLTSALGFQSLGMGLPILEEMKKLAVTTD